MVDGADDDADDGFTPYGKKISHHRNGTPKSIKKTIKKLNCKALKTAVETRAKVLSEAGRRDCVARKTRMKNRNSCLCPEYDTSAVDRLTRSTLNPSESHEVEPSRFASTL